MSDRAVRFVTRAMIQTFFRRVDVDGLERLPATGPVITVANHANGLVDGLLLMSTLPRWPRFLGKATLFDIAPLRPFLRLTGVIPVHRAKDAKDGKDATAGEDGRSGPSDREARNEATFAACRSLLRDGAMVSIFPEGISHDHDSLQPLRTGAARIALGAAFDDERARDLDIVPIGLAYDAKATFRSNAIVIIGDPIRVDAWSAEYASDPRSAVRSLTMAITNGLRAVAPDHPHAGRPDVSARRLRLRAVIRHAGSSRPDPALIAASPVALIGAVLHLVPYQIVKQSARLPRGESIRSTVKLLGSTGLFTVEWATLAIVAGRSRGRVAGVATLFAVPLSGYVAVRFAEALRDAASKRAPDHVDPFARLPG